MSRLNRHTHRRPPGLKGKEIGLYYRSLQMKSKEKKYTINLTVPPNVVSSLYNHLESIQNIAKEQNIYIPPIRKLNTIDTPNSADFIPLKSAKPIHEIRNRYSKTSELETSATTFYDDVTILDKITAGSSEHGIGTDNDIGFIIDSEIQAKGDSFHVKSIDIADLKEIKEENPNIHMAKYDITVVKKEEKFGADKRTTSDFLEMSGSDVDFIPIKKEKPDTTNYNLDSQSTSKSTHFISTSYTLPTDRYSSSRGSSNYKYGYEDIITGTFDEKLEECLAKGVRMNMKDRESYDLNMAMHAEYKDMLNREKYKKLMVFRQKLPAYQKSKELLDTIKANQVVVISGETGCGKSTQVPQIILDDAITNFEGASVKILVTQPRRIAASSLAMRVASERDEHLGNSVGYAVRLEKEDPRPQGSIFFCTTGILLAELEVNQGLNNYSHVILDEVHERDTDIDLSMCMLKKVLSKRSDLKLILMSATIDANKLSEYFNNCAMIEIEGLAYPVKDIYLEDILQLISYNLPPNSRPKTVRRGLQFQKKGKEIMAREMEKDIKYKADIARWLEPIKHKLDRGMYVTLQDSRIEELNIDLIFEVVKHICKGDPGAILIFLPGISDITKLLRMLTSSNSFPSSRYEIYPLHSKLPSLEQHRIFQRPPEHIRKIIIATNIAETSITIDDIVYVIDSGKIKYNGLNVEENVATLRTEWVSQANLRQRRGRAGRCQPGICYHLITSYRAQQLEERLLPEMQRSNLLEPVLAIKRLRLGKVAEALKLIPSPPAEATIQSAVRHLQQCGALDDQETLTPLGWHLARLPVHPAAGKLLVLGALFGCLDRAASVAAVWGFKDPFQLVIGKEKEVDAAKRRLALGEPSDHVAISEALIQWEQNDSYHEQKQFAYENFLSMNTLQLLSEMKNQLAGNLKQMGFLSSGDVKSAWENRNAHNLCLFRAIIAASLYPNIGTVKWFNINQRNINKPMRIKARTPVDGSVALHPSSVMCSGFHSSGGPICYKPGANWLVYWLKHRSSELFLFDVTLVYTLPLLFFGELNVSQAEEPDQCLISISSISVCCKKETTQLLYEMRSLLDSVLASKIMGSHSKTAKHDIFENEVLNAVIKLISAEDEGAEYLGDDDDMPGSDNFEFQSNRRWYK